MTDDGANGELGRGSRGGLNDEDVLECVSVPDDSRGMRWLSVDGRHSCVDRVALSDTHARVRGGEEERKVSSDVWRRNMSDPAWTANLRSSRQIWRGYESTSKTSANHTLGSYQAGWCADLSLNSVETTSRSSLPCQRSLANVLYVK